MLNQRAKSFIGIMVAIAIVAFILSIGVEWLIKYNIAQNESNAAATLKLISAALENYAKDKRGIFPADISNLTRTSPQYLDNNYIDESPLKGYNYSCLRLEPSGYTCSAVPVKCKLTGTMSYVVTTGGLFVSEECSKKE